jgi:hypothetical protein
VSPTNPRPIHEGGVTALTDYEPRRPDLEEVACGLGRGARGGVGDLGAFRSRTTPRGDVRFVEKSGMFRSPFRFIEASQECPVALGYGYGMQALTRNEIRARGEAGAIADPLSAAFDDRSIGRATPIPEQRYHEGEHDCHNEND